MIGKGRCSMSGDPCSTITEALDSIIGLIELEAFIDALRNPPAGCTPKPVTADEWQRITAKRIRLQTTRNSRG